MRRRLSATRSSMAGSRICSGLIGLPVMNRVTRKPSGRMNATTSGPTPTDAAAAVAACSTSRLMPSRWVSVPPIRIT